MLQELRACRSIEHTTVRDHERDAPRIADVGKRIRVEQNEICDFSPSHRAQGVECAQEFRWVVGRAAERFQGCEPRSHQQLELLMQAEPRIDERLRHVSARQQLHACVPQIARAIEAEEAPYDNRVGWRYNRGSMHPSRLHRTGNVLRQLGMGARAVVPVRVRLINDQGRSNPGMIACKCSDD